MLAVLVYHAYPRAMRGGFTGVDVFFVISGYLISNVIVSSLDAGRFSLREFYGRRVRRILPALLIVLAACFVAGWFLLLADEYKQLCSHIATGSVFASNIVLWAETGYFDQAAETKPLLHLWSLGIEEQFYLVWPILLAVAARLRIDRLKLAIVLAIGSFACNVMTVAHDPATAFFLPHTRAWELMIGAALAFLPRGKVLANARSLVGTGLVVVGVFVIDRSASFPGSWALLPTVGTALLVSAGPDAWLNAKVLASRPLVGLGLISYPLYLWHWPLLSFGRIIQSGELGPFARLGLLALATLLAWGTYAWIERPRRLTLSLVLALLVFGAIGHYGFVHDGWRGRAAVVHYTYNRDQLVRTPSIDDECKRYVRGGPSFPYCRFTNVHGAKTIALIGDSHAHAAYPGIAELMRDHGVSTLLMAHSGCAFDETCRQATQQMLTTLREDETIDEVFLFCRCAHYAPELLHEALQRTIDALHAMGKHVYVVTDPPELPFEPAACLPRPLRRTSSQCEFPMRKRCDLQGLHDATIIDTTDVFCPAGTCRAVRDDKLLFADDNHLSVAGSEFLARASIARFSASVK